MMSTTTLQLADLTITSDGLAETLGQLNGS